LCVYRKSEKYGSVKIYLAFIYDVPGLISRHLYGIGNNAVT